jgi:hypothetical protein
MNLKVNVEESFNIFKDKNADLRKSMNASLSLNYVYLNY